MFSFLFRSLNFYEEKKTETKKRKINLFIFGSKENEAKSLFNLKLMRNVFIGSNFNEISREILIKNYEVFAS